MRDGETAWIEALRDRGGPLVDAALPFATAPSEGGVPRGAAGLRALALRIEAFCAEEPPVTSEDAFLEGAGALLGLLLLDHLDGGAYAREGDKHGLRLRESFFDPFAALDASLDAERPAAELARRVREAEAEARGEGPMARVVEAFRRCLARERPDLHVASALGLHVALEGGVEVDLSRVLRATEGESDATLEVATGKLVALLPGGRDAGTPVDEARERLLPRLVSDAFLAGLAGSSAGPIYARPLGHGVHVALVLAYDGRSRFVREKELSAWGLDNAEATELAIARLAARSEHARLACLDTDGGPLIIARSGDGLDAARLLLPGLPRVLSRDLSAPFYVAIPHRDVLLATDARGREMLEARAEDEHRRAPHGICPGLFLVEAGRPIAPA